MTLATDWFTGPEHSYTECSFLQAGARAPNDLGDLAAKPEHY